MVAHYRSFHAEYVAWLSSRFSPPVHEAFCCDRKEITSAVVACERNAADVLLIQFQSYACALEIAPALLATRLPVLIWNTQQLWTMGPAFEASELGKNHGMHGSQDLCNVLLRAQRPFAMLTGHIDDARTEPELRAWFQALQAVNISRSLRIGQLGPAFQGMGDLQADPTQLLVKWGPAVVSISADDLVEELATIETAALPPVMAADREQFEFHGEIDPALHEEQTRYRLALESLVRRFELDGITVNFMAFGRDARLATIPFWGVNHLIAQGLGYAGEGDVILTALDALLQRLCGHANFTEMFSCDYGQNRILFYHMAEGNFAMAKQTARPIVLKNALFITEGQYYFNLVYPYQPGTSTFVTIANTGQGDYRMITFIAEVVDHEPLNGLRNAHFLAELKTDIGEFQNRYCAAGGPHHLTRVAGDQRGFIRKLANALRMELVEL